MLKSDKLFLSGIFVFVTLFVLVRYAVHDFDISTFIVAGDRKVDEHKHPYKIKIQENSDGYDGQSYYRMALNPFTTEHVEKGIQIDVAYRKQRIVYPLLTHLFSFGIPELVPWVMVLVNLFGLFFMFYYGLRILRYLEFDPKLIFIFAIQPGIYISLSRNLAEVLALSFFVASIYFLLGKKKYLFLIACTLALFTREETVLVVLPSIAYYVLGNIRKNQRYFTANNLLLFTPLILFTIWKAYIYFELGGYTSRLEFLPFVGFFEGFYNNILKNIGDNTSSKLLYFFPIYCGFLFVWYVSTFVYASKFLKFRSYDFTGLLSYCWLIWIVFALFLDYTIWEEEISFGRVLATLGFISFLLIAIHTKKWNKGYILFSIFIFLLVISRLIVFV